MRWTIYACVLAVGCGTSQVDESDLVGTYNMPGVDCDRAPVTIAADHSITFDGRPTTAVMIDGVRMDQTGAPNVTFQLDYTLGGEGGHLHEIWQLWMDHDGGSGTQNTCSIVLVRANP